MSNNHYIYPYFIILEMLIFSFDIKKILIDKLKNGNWLWSYDINKIDEHTFPDEILIEKTFIHLDICDINLLFHYYNYNFIKKVWRARIASQGDFLRTLNRFLAFYYFDIKNPDKYLKTLETSILKKYGA